MRICLDAIELQGVHRHEMQSIKIRAPHEQYCSKSREDLQTALASRDLSTMKIFVLLSAAMTIGRQHYLHREKYSARSFEKAIRGCCKINALPGEILWSGGFPGRNIPMSASTISLFPSI